MISIREYTEDDQGAICRVRDRARPDELPSSRDSVAFAPLAEDHEVEDIHRSEKFVTQDGELVVGFVVVDGDYLSYPYVDPEYYGRGIDRRLLRLDLGRIGPALSSSRSPAARGRWPHTGAKC